MSQPQTDEACPLQRVLVVEDHPFFRHGLVEWLNRQSGLRCCGEAESAAAARQAIAGLKPDLVLLDLGLQREDGLELIKQLMSENPALRILVLSQGEETVFAERALRAGARGYLMKGVTMQEVLSAIHGVLAGEIRLSGKMATRLLQRSLDCDRSAGAKGLEQLSDRELQVFQLVGAGLTPTQIAAQLSLSVKTIETHQEGIKRKLKLKGAPALAAAAAEWVQTGVAPGEAGTS